MASGSSTTPVFILFRGALNAHVLHKGAAWYKSQTCKDTFPEQVNRLSDNDNGILESQTKELAQRARLKSSPKGLA